MAAKKSPETREIVRKRYGEIARNGSGCCGSTCCDSTSLALKIGYSKTELAGIPEDANLGLSCGNPSAMASLKKGEVVLDLGSGAGFDAFVIAPKVGPTGRVIGVDMTADMLQKARHNIESFMKKTGLCNVEFRLGEIENLPVADNQIDVIVSNCVINLSPDKPRVWREAFRVLKAGGRISVSDLALKKPLPEKVRKNVGALVGCIAGASLVQEIQKMLDETGFTKVELIEKAGNIDAMIDKNDKLYKEVLECLPGKFSVNDYVTSLIINAWKPL